MLRILIVDDHTLFRESIIPVLEELEPTPIIHEAAGLAEALPIVQHYSDLDLILLDLKLPDQDGWHVLGEFHSGNMSTPILILTGSEDVSDIHRALSSGCSGYLSKTCSRHELLTGIKSIVSGDIYIANHLLPLIDSTRQIKQSEKPCVNVRCVENFSQRQVQVLELMGKGYANKVIADELSISEGTVKLHVSAVLRFLNATNRTEAVLVAKQRGFL